LTITERRKWCKRETQTKIEPDREAKIKAYAEALAYFIEEPKALIS
jgi:hypothetical protein